MSKEPSVCVPVTVLLELVRNYELQPQEEVSRDCYLKSKALERVAYRKYLSYQKGKANDADS